MNIIVVENLVKKYKDLTAVNQISFSVKAGSIFGLLGPNGAGKTTTVECIIGLMKFDEGFVEILSLNPMTDNKKLYKEIGVQLQETSYQDKIKVKELCEVFTIMYEKPLDYQKLLEQFGLIDKTNTYVNQLSGGERQKIAIILALIANPQVIILDELTTGLDPKSRREMWECIKNLKREGRTVFMTTHYMEEAAYLCDQIGIMNKGKLIAIDSVEGIIDKADIDITISFETEDDVFHIIKDELNKKINKIEINNTKVKIYTKSEDVLTDLIILLRDKKFNYRKIDIKRPTLEDAYLKLVGKEKETEGNATI